MTTRSELAEALEVAEADFAAAQVSTREAVSSLGLAEASVGRLLTLLRASQGGGGGGGEPSPLITALPGGLGTISSDNQFGWEFTAEAAISITAVTAYLNSSSGLVGRLWRVSGKELLAEVPISPTPNEWSAGELETPVPLEVGQNYIVTIMRSPSGNRTHYRFDYDGFPTGFEFAPQITYVAGCNSNFSSFPSTRGQEILWGIAGAMFTA